MRGLGQAAILGMAMLSGAAAAQDAKQTIQTLIANESEAGNHRGHYTYLSVEKSERTGGHTWTERVAETNWGKVKYLVAEDGSALSGDRLVAEKIRIEDQAARPEEFRRQESARVDDEQHAKQMLSLLPRAFLFDGPVPEGDNLRIRFRPNPDYSPNGMEERVLHAMSGSVLLEKISTRLREIQGNIPQDLNIGFGMLATIRAGSNFSTLREHVDGYDWKTETVHTAINGKALFLKTIARQQESRHSDFKKIPEGMTVADAVKLLEAFKGS